MKSKQASTTVLSRRQANAGLLALGGAFLLACVSESDDAPSNEGSEGSDQDGGSSDASVGSSDASGGSSDASVGSSDASSGPDAGSSAGAWARGGTTAMSDDYPSPFPLAASACVLAVGATQGPCTESADQVRRDISEGYTGLPMRLALRVVDASCSPISEAKVKIWHTQITGSYSGNTPNNGMCLKDASDSSKHYFRGVQTTDADGRVDFNSCFPGWYRGRAVHIHFTVSAGGKSFTSQLVFDQSLVNEIFSSHPEYQPYGTPDTTNATDNVVGGGNLASYVVVASRLDDGAMMAAKQLVVSLS